MAARLLPVAMVASLALVTVLWNAHAGLTWEGPSLAALALGTCPMLAVAGYAYARGAASLAAFAFFAYIYMVYPLLGVRLSYLVTTLDFPLIDRHLAGFDASIGFDWQAYANLIQRNGFISSTILTAYMSPIIQAIASAAIFSYLRMTGRQFEMLFTLALALFIVVAIYAVLPAVGPQSQLGRTLAFEQNIRALRSGGTGPFPYFGIVSFPSYHTVMAIVFTYSHRGIKATFWPVAALNGLMLFGIPVFGDHYAADMVAGSLVALTSIVLASRLYGGRTSAGA